MFFKVIGIAIVASIVWYYLMIIAQALGLLLPINTGKLTWKCLIPFYQFYQIFK